MCRISRNLIVFQVVLSLIAGAVGAGLHKISSSPPASASGPATADYATRVAREVVPAARSPDAGREQASATLEERVRALEESMSVIVDSLPSPPTSAPVAHPSTEQRRAAASAYREALLDAHAREPVDSGWAEGTSQRILREIAGVARHATVSSGPDCRSMSCVIGLSWLDSSDAEQEYNLVARQLAIEGCSRQIEAPSLETNGAYGATLFIECGSKTAIQRPRPN